MCDTPENAGRNQDGRFAPGRSGNLGGKPKSTRHRATMMAEKLFNKDASKIARRVISAATAGEPWACKLVIERIIPPARDRATPFTLPPITGPADIPTAVQGVLCAAGKGGLSIEDAERIVSRRHPRGLIKG
jgi:hypothetical protein